MVARALVDKPTAVSGERQKALTVPKLTSRRASVRHLGPEHCIAWQDNVQIILSRVAPTMPAMTEMANQLDQLGAKVAGGVGCLLIIRSDVAPPGEDVRRFIAIKLERSPMVAAAQVVLGTGFRGAAMRSMLSLLQLAIRPKFAMGIFGGLAAGCDWLTRVLPERGAAIPMGTDLSLTAQELVAQFF
jgi:hypothetical protein